jgi:hypothetical protein
LSIIFLPSLLLPPYKPFTQNILYSKINRRARIKSKNKRLTYLPPPVIDKEEKFNDIDTLGNRSFQMWTRISLMSKSKSFLGCHNRVGRPEVPWASSKGYRNTSGVQCYKTFLSVIHGFSQTLDRLEKLARDKHSSLLRKSVNTDKKVL